jgi:hypothetical protein
MSVKIIEVVDGRLKITPECYTIKELKDIMDKHKNKAEPYLLYAHYMGNDDTPYANFSELDRSDAIITDLTNTIAPFNDEDPLLAPAIKKLKNMYSSPLKKLFEVSQKEIHRMSYYLESTPYSSDDLSQRKSILQDLGKLAKSIADTKKQLDEEKLNAKGAGKVGRIR